MSQTEWRIPPWTLRWLDEIPVGRSAAVLMRHSVRPELPPNDPGNAVPITEEGARLARELGGRIGARLASIRTSPVPRCVQTAEALAGGAGIDATVRTDRLLGDPGVFVLDGRRAWGELAAAWPRERHGAARERRSSAARDGLLE